MKENPLQKLHALGQSLWLDYIRRDFIASGELKEMIATDGIRGMTTNPAIFRKAIMESSLYDKDIRRLAKGDRNVQGIYERLSQVDIQNAADEYRGIYDKSYGEDGYVSVEVNPHLAHDLKASLAEARRLWSAVDRPNVMIKIPATPEGLGVIQALITEGINVNVTLIFGLTRYRQVAEAFLCGMEARLAQGKSLALLASVASFFVSRIDSMVDPMLESLFEPDGPLARLARVAHGQIATASAILAYQVYRSIFESDRFRLCSIKGGMPQRLLWASIGSKNPAYSEIKYMEQLIGNHTVTTVPLKTMAAYRKNGKPQVRLEHDVSGARRTMSSLAEMGINIDSLTRRLEEQGVQKFILAYDEMMESIVQKCTAYNT